MALATNRVVLVVEDDDSMREAIERLLQAAGFGTSTFGSAEALLAEHDAAGAVCVISDLKLPAMSGLELLRELRTRVGWPPVIMITAHDSAAVRSEAERSGAAAYLSKPFQGSALLDAIKGIEATAGRA
jgi:FixJ family two-component response regulator